MSFLENLKYFFTKLALRRIQSSSLDVRVSVPSHVIVDYAKTVRLRLLVEECTANIGIALDIFGFLKF